MRSAKERNVTLKLPTGLLWQLKERAAAEGASMNAYLEGLLTSALSRDKDRAQRVIGKRLRAWAKNGLYDLDQPLTREEAHDRHL
jgi:hypothetical protein